MNKRIKLLRKSLGLTLEKFGEQIGIKKNSLSQIENGKNNVTEQLFKSICREFNVNENWLRTGEGDMFLPNRKSEINKLTQQLLSEESDSFKNRFINMLANLTVDEWKLLEEKAKELVDPPAPSVISEDNGQMAYSFISNKSSNTEVENSDIPIEELEEQYKKNRLNSVQKTTSSALNTIKEKKDERNNKNIVNG